MTRRTIKDDDGAVVAPGHRIIFGYGIPIVSVTAEVIERDGRLIALTPGHNPPEIPLAILRKHVGAFWVKRCENEQHAWGADAEAFGQWRCQFCPATRRDNPQKSHDELRKMYPDPWGGGRFE